MQTTLVWGSFNRWWVSPLVIIATFVVSAAFTLSGFVIWGGGVVFVPIAPVILALLIIIPFRVGGGSVLSVCLSTYASMLGFFFVLSLNEEEPILEVLVMHAQNPLILGSTIVVGLFGAAIGEFVRRCLNLSSDDSIY